MYMLTLSRATLPHVCRAPPPSAAPRQLVRSLALISRLINDFIMVTFHYAFSLSQLYKPGHDFQGVTGNPVASLSGRAIRYAPSQSSVY